MGNEWTLCGGVGRWNNWHGATTDFGLWWASTDGLTTFLALKNLRALRSLGPLCNLGEGRGFETVFCCKRPVKKFVLGLRNLSMALLIKWQVREISENNKEISPFKTSQILKEPSKLHFPLPKLCMEKESQWFSIDEWFLHFSFAILHCSTDTGVHSVCEKREKN